MQIEFPARRKHTIGLTPLIDVVFILLIFFMLATSLLDWRGLSLATGSAPAQPDQAPAAIVRLAADGQLYYKDTPYSTKELAELLKQELAAKNISAAILQPDQSVTLGPTVQVFDSLAGAGVAKLSLSQSVAN